MRYGYARVSTSGQDLEIQLQTLKAEGCDKIYAEKFSGTKCDREQFNELLSVLKKGDTLIVTKLDRFARSMTQGSQIVNDLINKGIRVHILNIGVLDNTAASKLIRNIFFSFAEFERDMIVERTQEGKALAKQDPNFVEGRPRTPKAQLNHAIELLETKTYKQVVELSGISKSTLIREVRRRKESNLINK